MDNQDKIAEQAAEILRLHWVLTERQAQIGKLMGEAARAGIAGGPVRESGELPEDVRYALDRMCLPLDTSRLSGVTASEDARCMAVIKKYIEQSAAPAAPLPAQPEQSAPTDLSKRLRDWAGRATESGNIAISTKYLADAADEIERYYGGMMAWKRTAEAKDRASVETAAPGASTEGAEDRSRDDEDWFFSPNDG